jgi:predicted nuclease of predicted toxin-antitoxin system
MDQHFPSPITNALRRREINVLTTQEDGTTRAADESLLARATALGRVFCTQDADFLTIAQRWLEVGRDFTGLAFARIERRAYARVLRTLS